MFPCSGREATRLRNWAIHSNVVGLHTVIPDVRLVSFRLKSAEAVYLGSRGCWVNPSLF